MLIAIPCLLAPPVIVAAEAEAPPRTANPAAENPPAPPPADDRAPNPRLDELAREPVGQVTPEASIEDFRPRNREARLIETVPPEYPKDLSGSGVSAEVLLSVIVDRLGRASHVRVEDSPDQEFTDAALDAVAQWQFLPRLRDGRASNAPMRLSVFVAEELGDRAYFDYLGGRIALENVTYAAEPENPIRRLFGLRPAYPFDLLVTQTPGEVVLECSVGEDGEPHDITIVESTRPEFALAAQGAFLHWHFSPAMYHGRAVPARLRYRISFQPQDYDGKFLAMAKALSEGRLEGLESARTIDRQPVVRSMINPSFYEEEGKVSVRRHRVTVKIVVTETGEVRLPRIESAPDELSGYVALAAVGYWRFTPARKKGVPVMVDVSLPITF